MHFGEHERTALFIDGVNLYLTTRALRFDIDFKRLLMLFRKRARLVRALYYTVETEEASSIRPLIDWLNYNGFTVITKPTREFLDASGQRRFKSSMDVELAVDALRLAKALDHVVLFSGDGDFRVLVAALQNAGKRVTVISSLSGVSPMVGDELRRQADQFVELADLQPIIGRERGSVSRPVASP